MSAFKSFLRKYKNDDEIKLELATAYIMESKHSRADKVLAELYAGAGPYADDAYDMLHSKDLSRRVWLKRADSLMNHLDFAGAEDILRGQLSPEGWNRSIKKQLARALFRLHTALFELARKTTRLRDVAGNCAHRLNFARRLHH